MTPNVLDCELHGDVDILRKIEKISENLHNVFFKNYYYGDLIDECGLDRLK